MAPDQVVRFTIGTDFGPRSGVWRIWAHNDDVYVQHQGMRAEMKTSLHASGVNRHAMAESGAARWIPQGDRAFLKWGPPADFDVGGKVLLAIIIPSAHLTVPPEEPEESEKRKIVLIDPPSVGDATFVSIVLTEPTTEPTAPGGILASWALPSRGHISIVDTQQPYGDALRHAVDAALPGFATQIDEHLEDGPLPENCDRMCAVFWLDPNEFGVARIVEVGVELGHR
jgi:hypothetical protein